MFQKANSKIVHTQEFKVSSRHCDLRNYVNDVAYVQWIQDATIAAYKAIVFLKDITENSNLAWFVRRHEIEYLTPAFIGERIRLVTSVERVTLSVFFLRTQFVCLTDARLICQAMTQWCYFDVEQNQPTKIPHSIRTLFLD